MTVQAASSQYNIYRCPNDQVGQIYVFLDPLSAIAFARTDKRMQAIFQKELPKLIKTQFENPFPISIPPEEQYLRLALSQRQAGALCEMTLQGHEDWVKCLQITPDKTRALSGSADHTLKIWDLRTGTCTRTLRGHESWIRCIQITPDGTRVISGSNDKTLKIWNLQTGECVGTLRGHRDRVCCLQITPDGTRVISGSDDKTLKIWNLQTGECVGTLLGHTSWITWIQINPDGKTALSGSQDSTLKIWDLETEECTRTLQGHKGGINCVQVNADRTRAISGSRDYTLKVWDLETGGCIRTLIGHKNWISCMQINKDWTRVLSGSCDKTVKIWDLETGKCVKTLYEYKKNVSPVKLNTNEILALTECETLKIWSLKTEKCIGTLRGHDDWIICMHMNAAGTGVISGSKDATIKMWNLVPLPEERVIAIAKGFFQQDRKAKKQFEELPFFVKKALLDMEPPQVRPPPITDESKDPEEHLSLAVVQHISNRTFNRYIAGEFLPSIAKLFRDAVLKKLPLYKDSAFRRFANFPHAVKEAVYRSLAKDKGVLEGESAFYGRGGYFVSDLERANAIHKVACNASQFI